MLENTGTLKEDLNWSGSFPWLNPELSEKEQTINDRYDEINNLLLMIQQQELPEMTDGKLGGGGMFGHRRGNRFAPTLNGALAVYPKKITAASSPAKTSIIVSGESSGAVLEFNVTITHRATGISPADDVT